VKRLFYGQSVRDKILVCPGGKGSTGGPTFAWLARAAGNAPKAVICTAIEQVLALAVLTAEIPTVDSLDQDPTKVIIEHCRSNGTRAIGRPPHLDPLPRRGGEERVRGQAVEWRSISYARINRTGDRVVVDAGRGIVKIVRDQ
jgi:hypothetical protein